MVHPEPAERVAQLQAAWTATNDNERVLARRERPTIAVAGSGRWSHRNQPRARVVVRSRRV
jgi:hypothetical protein